MNNLLLVLQLAVSLLAAYTTVKAVARFVASKRSDYLCKNCFGALPRFRKPLNWRQGLFGGWTCPHCGAEVDRRGEVRDMASIEQQDEAS